MKEKVSHIQTHQRLGQQHSNTAVAEYNRHVVAFRLQLATRS